MSLKTKIDLNLIKNFASLSTVQVFNNLTPLICVPILINIYGLEGYGIIATAFSLATFFSSLSDFGFELIGTKYIAQNQSDKLSVEKTFSSIFIVKVFLMLFFLIAYVILINFVDVFRDNIDVFYSAIGIFASRFIIFNWFFQGMEKMKFIPVTNVFASIIYVLGVVFFINANNGLALVTLIRSIGFFISGLFSIIVVIFYFKIKMRLCIPTIKKQTTESFFVFTSILSSSILQNLPTLIVSKLFDFEIAGYYNTLEKMVLFGKQVIMTINQTIFPRLTASFNKQNLAPYFKLWKKVTYLLVSIALLTIAFLIIIKPFIFNFLFETNFSNNDINTTFYVLIVLILTYSIINSLGLNGLLLFSKNKELAYSQVIPVIIFILIITFFKNSITNIAIIGVLLISIDILIILIRIILIKNIISKYK